MAMDREQAAQALLSGEAWEGFCDALKAAGADLHRETAMRSALDAAEGHRFITRMLLSVSQMRQSAFHPRTMPRARCCFSHRGARL